MLDAQTMEHLVNAGMNLEDAAIKAPEESVAKFQKQFAQELYKKKYRAKDHMYFQGVTNSLFVDNKLIPFNRHAKTHKCMQ